MKSITKTLEFISDNPLKVTIESRHLPGGSNHNLVCWVCESQPAVYSMHPDWAFFPCWKCQKQIKGIWSKKKGWGLVNIDRHNDFLWDITNKALPTFFFVMVWGFFGLGAVFMWISFSMVLELLGGF